MGIANTLPTVAEAWIDATKRHGKYHARMGTYPTGACCPRLGREENMGILLRDEEIKESTNWAEDVPIDKAARQIAKAQAAHAVEEIKCRMGWTSDGGLHGEISEEDWQSIEDEVKP